MQKTPLKEESLKDLAHLPAFAGFLLTHKLQEFSVQLIHFSQAFKIPLLKYLEHYSEEELIALVKKSNEELLDHLARNQAEEHIRIALNRWLNNELPRIDRHAVTAEDINLATYVRKRAFLHFLPQYCRDTEQVIELVKEIDLYCMQAELAATNTYIDLLKNSLNENTHLIQNINNTIPGAVYVFDVINYKGLYSNNKLPSIIGYSQEELNEMGSGVLGQLVHPADRSVLKNQDEQVKKANDGEIITCKYRIRRKDGSYQWLRNYESAFHRSEEGHLLQKIGITLNIDKEQTIEEELQKNEERFRQAEALAKMGNYVWNPETGGIKWSEELYRIYGFEHSDEVPFDQVELMIHPDDLESVQNQIRKAIEQQSKFDFYYRIITRNKEQKILHTRGQANIDEKTGKTQVIGTVQDETEKERLLKELQKTSYLYRQAEELANMGNWSWDIETNKISWTDQLYRIYGLVPQSEEINIERFLSFVHPQDREEVSKGVDKIYTDKKLDYTFRIITQEGITKVLRSVALVQYDEKGNPVSVIGTERDITEKQNLIDKLKYSESLYKQAQSLAHVGNWSWYIADDRMEWSDELFRIFGLEPQSLSLNLQGVLDRIHPDDREKLKTRMEEAIHSRKSWELTHRIIKEDGGASIVFATGEVLTDENGSPVIIFGTAQDITERQSLIDRLQESEKLFKQAQNLAHLGNWTLDIKTNEFIWSDEMYRIYELEKKDKFSIEEWSDFLSPEEKDSILQYFEKCMREHLLYDRIHKIILRNGKVKTIHRKGEFIYNNEGEAIKMIGTTQDITEEYRVQQELKENQTFIRKITDATPSIIASYNINSGKYVFISEGLEKLLGYDTREVMEQGVAFFSGIIHPDDIIQIMDKNARALADANEQPDKNDMVVEFTYRMRHKNGTYRWFHTYGTIFDRNADQKVEHVLNISLDVTEQVDATQKIKDQEHFIQQIADASPTILYLYDVDTQSIAYINREIFFVLGYLPEEVIEAGESVTEILYHPEDFPLLPGRRQSGKTFQQVDSMIQYECRMKNKEGSWRWLLVREIVFKTDEQGNIRQILGAALDINRRKEMEKTILQNTLLLEQSNASLEEFAYVASHDLKEPLRKISTFGDRLVATQIDKMTPDGKVYLQKIVDASQRMQVMISDLLSISMISGNRAFENFSLQKILEETLQTLEYKIEQQNALIRSTPLPEANIIPSQFRQLFQNLLSNSLKFVQPGKQPVVTISHNFVDQQDLAHYQLTKPGRYHRIEISDNGIGFENEFAGKIFAIFQRLHGRSEYEGSGIGLAICKKIVEHHGGLIYASGVPDVGATFTIILPA